MYQTPSIFRCIYENIKSKKSKFIFILLCFIFNVSLIIGLSLLFLQLLSHDPHLILESANFEMFIGRCDEINTCKLYSMKFLLHPFRLCIQLHNILVKYHKYMVHFQLEITKSHLSGELKRWGVFLSFDRGRQSIYNKFLITPPAPLGSVKVVV